MPRLVVASMRRGAGKTTMIVGLGRAMKKKIGYLKPFGDRLLYRKKRLWDYDAALVEGIFGLDDSPEDLSIGFDHSKLRFMYDEDGMREKLQESLSHVERTAELVFIEGGAQIGHGICVHLDAISLAKTADATLVIVVSGDEGAILDDIVFIQNQLRLEGVRFGGIILNKVQDIEASKDIYLSAARESGVPVLGVVPHVSSLTRLSLRTLVGGLFAKAIAGEGGLDRVVKEIFVGAMSADAARRLPSFTKPEKLVITSGDRSDMILAALETGAAGIVLTNNILPPANIISMATERDTPLLLAAADTYEVARQIDDLDRLLTREDETKIELLEKLAQKHLDLKTIAGD